MSESYLRIATVDDIDLLYKWANDKTTRRNAFNSRQITYEEHQQWFFDKLEADNSNIYIYCKDEIPIGQVRIDIVDGNGLISFSIDAGFRSHGYGSKIINLLEGIIKTESPEVKILSAQVKKDNIASKRIFERLNYVCIEKVDYFEYTKETGINK